MFDLPMETHRYLVEPVSDHMHLKKILIKRFLSFIQQINKSSKLIPKQLLNVIMNDTRSVTGSNLKRILILTKKTKVEDITSKDIEDIEYAKMCQEEKWRIEMIKELTDIKFGQLELDGFSNEECEEILNFACVS